MTEQLDIVELMDEYIRNAKYINDEEIKIVKEGFDLIKKKFEVDIIEYKWLISVFEDKIKRAEKITGNRTDIENFIKRLNVIIIDSEQLIKDAQEGILDNDNMKIAFERAIE